MSEHPTEEMMVLFAENALQGEAKTHVELHLRKCSKCALGLAVMLDLHDAEKIGASSALTPRQVQKFRQTVILPHVKSRRAQQSETSIDSNGLFGLGMGLGSFFNGLSPTAPGFASPMLASGHLGNSTDDVRKSDSAHSREGEQSMTDDHRDFNYHSNHGDHNMSTEFSEPDKTFGTPPQVDPSAIQQHYKDTCAIRSQEIILRDFGINISEQQLRTEAAQSGWYQPGNGTPMQDIGNLLESHGVAVNRMTDANIFNISNELAQGHKVIVGVNSSELWDRGLSERFLHFIGVEQPDHALIVSSIDTTDPKDVKVILTDPGTGQVAAQYSMEQFLDSWKDSGCTMVSTAEPAPSFAAGMQNFDYSLGHLPEIGQMPYADFLQLHDFALNDADPATIGRMEDIYSQAAHNYSDLQHQLHQPLSIDGMLQQPLMDDPNFHIVDNLISLAKDESVESNPLSGFFHLDSHFPGDTDLGNDGSI